VIAEPNSSTPEALSTSVSTMPSSLDAGALSADELYQLTLYKWRYSLEAYGFEQGQVRELMFLKWLYATRRVHG
jgi:hypothetical protein